MIKRKRLGQHFLNSKSIAKFIVSEANINNKDIVFEDLCFQAQQAAEKAIKALYVYYLIEPPRTHNLIILLNGIRE